MKVHGPNDKSDLFKKLILIFISIYIEMNKTLQYQLQIKRINIVTFRCLLILPTINRNRLIIIIHKVVTSFGFLDKKDSNV